MPISKRHGRPLFQFIRRVLDVPTGFSKESLQAFRTSAVRDYPSLVPIIDQYITLAESGETDVDVRKSDTPKQPNETGQMHLFDLLRDRRLFVSNSDLAEFAGRILPNMSRHRFDKLSRSDIAARIIEYLEERDARTRAELERSMRDAIATGTPKPSERRDFFSKWEKIIKGIEL